MFIHYAGRFSAGFGEGHLRPCFGVPTGEPGTPGGKTGPATGVTMAGRGDLGLAGQPGVADLTLEAGRGQSMLGVTGLAFIPGEAGRSTVDLGSGVRAPDRPPVCRGDGCLTCFGDMCWSASRSAFTGRGDGT